MANPPAGLQVQVSDGDRLHVHVVTHCLHVGNGSDFDDLAGLSARTLRPASSRTTSSVFTRGQAISGGGEPAPAGGLEAVEAVEVDLIEWSCTRRGESVCRRLSHQAPPQAGTCYRRISPTRRRRFRSSTRPTAASETRMGGLEFARVDTRDGVSRLVTSDGKQLEHPRHPCGFFNRRWNRRVWALSRRGRSRGVQTAPD